MERAPIMKVKELNKARSTMIIITTTLNMEKESLYTFRRLSRIIKEMMMKMRTKKIIRIIIRKTN